MIKNIKIDADLHNDLKIKCAIEKRTLRQVVEELKKKYLGKK